MNNKDLPDKFGFYGEYGGKFVPETLMFALAELEETYKSLRDNNEFQTEFYRDLSQFVGRPHHYILQKDSLIISEKPLYG